MQTLNIKRMLYTLLGGGLVIAGQLVVRATTSVAIAQNEATAEFHTLTVRSLQIVNQYGKLYTRLEKVPGEDDGNAVIQVFNESKVPIYQAGSGEMGGWVKMSYANGNPGILMSVTPSGGRISVKNRENTQSARMWVDLYGGSVDLRGLDEQRLAALTATPEVGMVDVRNRYGQRLAWIWGNTYGGLLEVANGYSNARVHLGSNANGGNAIIYGNSGKSLYRVWMSVDSNDRGLFYVYNKDGERRVRIGGNENGGVISVYDKKDLRASMYINSGGAGYIETP